MKIITCVLLFMISHSCLNAQSPQSDIVKFYSQMKMVVDLRTSQQTNYSESSLIVMDFKRRTINVHEKQFTLDMVKLLPDKEGKDFTAVNISCIDDKQKECTVSTCYFKSGAIVVRITYDDFDYVYNIKK